MDAGPAGATDRCSDLLTTQPVQPTYQLPSAHANVERLHRPGCLSGVSAAAWHVIKSHSLTDAALLN